MLKTTLGIVLAALVAWRLIRKFLRSRDEAAGKRKQLFDGVADLLEDPALEELAAPDHPILKGSFQGLPVTLRPIVDTLAIRKLPSLWLQITMPGPMNVGATFNFMMRPAGPTTFSNFDNLPHIIASPDGLPRNGLSRSDDPDKLPPVVALLPAFTLFANPRMKELLVSPKGVRIVLQLAEADRAQYGVFRQAAFGDITINPELLREILGRMADVVANLRQSQSSEVAA